MNSQSRHSGFRQYDGLGIYLYFPYLNQLGVDLFSLARQRRAQIRDIGCRQFFKMVQHFDDPR